MTTLTQGLDIIARCFPGVVIQGDHRSAEDAKVVSLFRQLSLLDLIDETRCRAELFVKKPFSSGGIRRPRPVPQRRPFMKNSTSSAPEAKVLAFVHPADDLSADELAHRHLGVWAQAHSLCRSTSVFDASDRRHLTQPH
jgi:hypothetical protein